MGYAFSENFALPLSHDEVVHGKASLLNKMPGNDWQKFREPSRLLRFLWAHPGKKLLFVGQEFAQRREWSDDRGLDFDLRQYVPHNGIQQLVKDFNRLPGRTPRCMRATTATSPSLPLRGMARRAIRLS